MTKEERDRLKVLYGAATPLPWMMDYNNTQLLGISAYRGGDKESLTPADGRLILAATEAVPALLDALDAADAENARLRKAINEALAVYADVNTPVHGVADVLRKAVG